MFTLASIKASITSDIPVTPLTIANIVSYTEDHELLQTLRLAADNMPHKVLGLECYSIIAQIATLEVIEFIVERFEDGAQGFIKYSIIYENIPLFNFLYDMVVIERKLVLQYLKVSSALRTICGSISLNNRRTLNAITSKEVEVILDEENTEVIEACLYVISEVAASLLFARIRDYRSMSVLKLRTAIDKFAFTCLIRAKNYDALRYLIDNSEVPKLDHVDIDYLDEIQEHMLREYV